MKLTIRIILFSVLVFFGLRFFLFNNTVDPSALEQPVVSQKSFLQHRDAYVGQQRRFQGVVIDSYYLLGVGFYQLMDSNGDAITIFCDHYPPPSDQLFEVVVYVSPLAKLDNSLTLQLEVGVPEVLLSFPNSPKTLSYEY